MLRSLITLTGVPSLDASADFRRARRAQLVARAGRRLARGRRASHPPALPDTTVMPTRGARLEVIPLRSIVGTLEPTAHFDTRFRPATNVVRTRWERVALAHRTGVGLPPITVMQRGDGNYVVDGRHRVSVALALGLHDIEAWVTRVAAPGGTGASA